MRGVNLKRLRAGSYRRLDFLFKIPEHAVRQSSILVQHANCLQRLTSNVFHYLFEILYCTISNTSSLSRDGDIQYHRQAQRTPDSYNLYCTVLVKLQQIAYRKQRFYPCLCLRVVPLLFWFRPRVRPLVRTLKWQIQARLFYFLLNLARHHGLM